MRVHVLPAIGGAKLRALKPAKLNRLYAGLERRDGKGDLSARARRHVAMIIGRMLRDAVRWGRVPRNVASLFDAPKVRTHAVMATWAPAELRQFLDRVSPDRYYAAWLLLATTGARRGEVLGLPWDDVDLDAGRISITQTLTTARNKVIFSTPKTSKGRRSIALDPATVAALRDHRKRQLEERMKWGPGYEDQGLVFCRENGTPIHPNAFSRNFDQQVKAAGLPRIRLHDLRHTHATLALQAGVHPKVVSERLGHSSISITLDTYSHAVPALEADAADKIAALIWGG